jgi:hypothetical protein
MFLKLQPFAQNIQIILRNGLNWKSSFKLPIRREQIYFRSFQEQYDFFFSQIPFKGSVFVIDSVWFMYRMFL